MAHEEDLITEVRDLLADQLAKIESNRSLARKRRSPFLIASIEGSDAYVQALASHKGRWLWLEVASAQSAPALSSVLTRPRKNALKALGFERPVAGTTNQWLCIRGGTLAKQRKAAAVLAEVLVKVFGLRDISKMDVEVHLLENQGGVVTYAMQDVQGDAASRHASPGAPVYPFGTWAVEVDGEAGVRLYDVREGCEDLQTGLAAQGLRVLCATRLRQGASQTPLKPWQPTRVDYGEELCGYRFDPMARCWRPVDQPFTPPASSPLQGVELRLTTKLPKAGWLPVRLEAGDINLEFDVSNVFDPFYPQPDPLASENWVAWLKAIAEGGNPRLVINLEGEILELHVLEPDMSTVRFLAARGWRDGWRPEFDVRVPRRSLVDALYRPLLELWESDAFTAGWRNWCFEGSDNDYPAPWSIRSNLLDAWLR
ncbi:hypothetical protein GGQ61_001996 [Phenylobacterium haematophilum]|uniref:TY-Chap N-terminal domain-containing protein n=1 Tax=Phenylobacterium haematophilum TaxID=98513 RepID=A0A839ZZY1_9CAUL|nr:hypothetical protein [Phenylobacterium haematophilum]MBB3891279.1 hypothetical protein [Phenylobacterium haematophilum]